MSHIHTCKMNGSYIATQWDDIAIYMSGERLDNYPTLS